MGALKRIVLPIVLLTFVAAVTACGHKEETKVVNANPNEMGHLGRGDAQLVLGSLVKTDDEIKGDDVDFAYLDVKNTLNRTISIDFIGNGHVELSVGDTKSGRAELAAGSYTVSVSAPGLKPAKGNISVRKKKIYTIEVYQTRSKED